MRAVSRQGSRRIIFIAMTLILAALILTQFDRGVSDWSHEALRPHDGLLQKLTLLGDGRVLVPLCLAWALVAFALRKRKGLAAPLIALASFAISGALAHGLKIVLGRPRPYALGDRRYASITSDAFYWFSTNYDFASFPSGHSTAVFSIAWIAARSLKRGWAQALILIAAALIAFTRVALAKHFFADTVAGAALGILISEIVFASWNFRSPKAAH